MIETEGRRSFRIPHPTVILVVAITSIVASVAIPPALRAYHRRGAIDALRRRGAGVVTKPGSSSRWFLARAVAAEEVVSVSLDRRTAVDLDLVGLKELPEVRELYINSFPGVFDGGPPLNRIAVTDAGLVHLCGLKNLEVLHLEGTRIDGEGLQHLAGLPRLYFISLNDTPFGDEGLAHLPTSVASISLNRTAVTDAGLVHLTGPRLGVIHLCDTRVTDAGLVHLSRTTGLSYLHLRGTQITDAGLAQLSALPLLSLSLMDTKVTDACLIHLKGLKRLQILDLRLTDVTEEGVADLKQSLPQLTVARSARPSSE